MQTVTIGNCTLYRGDCLDVLPLLADRLVNCVLADLPYGTSYCSWDSVIPLDKLWQEYSRLMIGNGAFVFTAVQPFTTKLIQSKIDWFRYEWIWDKENASNFANAKKMPLKQHENVLVFGRGQTPYHPIKTPGAKNHKRGTSTQNKSESRLMSGVAEDDLSGMKYPKSILYFPKHSSQCGRHPTQKPVDLMEYLVKTYTTAGEVVLDNVMGSGTTGAACIKAGRKFIGIEKDQGYFDDACKRLEEEWTFLTNSVGSSSRPTVAVERG